MLLQAILPQTIAILPQTVNRDEFSDVQWRGDSFGVTKIQNTKYQLQGDFLEVTNIPSRNVQ